MASRGSIAISSYPAGFDYYYGIPYSNDMDRPYCPLPLMEQEEVIVAPVGHDSLTIRYTNKTVEFIKSHKESPFFIYLCHNMTHNPLAASPAFQGKVSERTLWRCDRGIGLVDGSLA